MSSTTYTAVFAEYPSWGTDNTWAAWGFDDLTFRPLYIPFFALAQSANERGQSSPYSSDYSVPWECRISADVYIGTEGGYSLSPNVIKRFESIDDRLRGFMSGIDAQISVCCADEYYKSELNTSNMYLNQCQAAQGTFVLWTWNDLLAKAAELTSTTAISKVEAGAYQYLPVSQLKTWMMQRYAMVNLLRWRNIGFTRRNATIRGDVSYSGSKRQAVISAGTSFAPAIGSGVKGGDFQRLAEVSTYSQTASVSIGYTYDVTARAVNRLASIKMVFGNSSAYGGDYDAFGYGIVPTTAGDYAAIDVSGTSYSFITPPVPDNEHSGSQFGIKNVPLIVFSDLSTCFTLYDDVETRYSR